MAATLRLADVRLLAGVTLVVFPRCLIGRRQAQGETPSDEQRPKRDAIATGRRAVIKSSSPGRQSRPRPGQTAAKSHFMHRQHSA
jgi:hypothetical protein